MKQYIVELPLRRVSLRLEDKAQTSLGSDALAAYLNLHQQLWEIKGLIEQYGKKFDELLALVNSLCTAYAALEEEAKRYGRLGGFADEEEANTGSDNTPVDIELDQYYLQELITRYSKLVASYMDERFNPENLYKTIEEAREKYYEQFDYFDEHYFSPIIQAYDDVQIDTCSFDDDVEAFRELNGNIMDAYESRCYDEWKDMCERVKELDRQIRQLNPHLECISNTLKIMYAKHHNAGLN